MKLPAIDGISLSGKNWELSVGWQIAYEMEIGKAPNVQVVPI
jgi:hypothetical protein